MLVLFVYVIILTGITTVPVTSREASGSEISVSQITFLQNQARACGQALLSIDNDNVPEGFDLKINAGKGIGIGPLDTTRVTILENSGNVFFYMHVIM